MLVLFENKISGKDEFFGRDEFSNSVIVNSKENLIGKLEEVNIIDGTRIHFGVIDRKLDKKEFAA